MNMEKNPTHVFIIFIVFSPMLRTNFKKKLGAPPSQNPKCVSGPGPFWVTFFKFKARIFRISGLEI